MSSQTIQKDTDYETKRDQVIIVIQRYIHRTIIYYCIIIALGIISAFTKYAGILIQWMFITLLILLLIFDRKKLCNKYNITNDDLGVKSFRNNEPNNKRS